MVVHKTFRNCRVWKVILVELYLIIRLTLLFLAHRNRNRLLLSSLKNVNRLSQVCLLQCYEVQFQQREMEAEQLEFRII